ncbi:MAG: 23S rRNA (guanosine(2251)-2'-O)-methyltransferase RlmB [Bacilli bacterium]|nr:23S rRNA (guanosine(2251)-2'-O)-methyltransferase RlmB [Bacilli bacterium]
MLVCGKNVCRDLLKKGNNIKKVYLVNNFNDKDIVSIVEKLNLNVIYKEKREIDNLCPNNNQGIILDIPDYDYGKIEDIDEDFVVLLDHLEDPHNLGAIIRTCEAAGVKSVVIPKDRQVQVNSTVMKTSVGTLNNVNVIRVTNLNNAIDELKKMGFWIVGTSLTDKSIDYRKIDYSGKIALVIGNEGSGISALVSKKCDFIAKIPMYGETNSLNASVAAGIMIYEIIRNRK